MGSDELVARLRTRGGRPDGFGLGLICDQAADEIERLTAQLAEARESERAALTEREAQAKLDGVTFLTIRLQGKHLYLFQHLSTAVYLAREGRRTTYWAESGMFWPHEADQAQDYANKVIRPGLKATIISRTLTSP